MFGPVIIYFWKQRLLICVMRASGQEGRTYTCCFDMSKGVGKQEFLDKNSSNEELAKERGHAN